MKVLFRLGPALPVALFSVLLLSGCGLFGAKQDQKLAGEGGRERPGGEQPAVSDWDARIGTSVDVTHADRVGTASIETLAMGGPAVAPKVAEFVADPSPQVRRKAIDTLAGWGKEAQPAVATLLPHVRNVDAEIRQAATEALARIGSPRGLDGLKQASRDQIPEVKVWAHAGLAVLSGDCEDGQEEVADILKGGRMKNPGAAAEALALTDCASKKAVDRLTAAFLGGEELVRVAAARAIGNIGPRAAAAVPALVEALGEKDWRVRQAVLLALARIGPPAAAAVVPLAEALKDPSPRFRELAAHALGELGPAAKSAEEALRRAERDQEAMVQAAAKRALFKILGEEKPED